MAVEQGERLGPVAGAFDQAITDFSKRYADQNERDYEPFVGAIRSEKPEAFEGD